MTDDADQLTSAAEALVVGLAATGDRAAFAELVRRRQSWLRNLLRRLAGDPTLADDLAQQVLLTVWQELPRLRDPARFPGWLKQVAVNTWRQHLRRNDPLRRAAEHRDETSDGTAPRPAIARDLDRALAELEPAVRLCVVLSHHEGHSHSEVAALTGLPLGTVKSHIRRGSERLREALAAYRPDHEGHAA